VFRLTGASKDFAVIGSDAGTITIVEYDIPTNSFKQGTPLQLLLFGRRTSATLSFS
jgi:hypothetical protein